MSTGVSATEGATGSNDWEHHWNAYGDAAEGSPANVYRRELIVRLLGTPGAGATVLDIGSGQGELLHHLERRFPGASLWGVEYSAAGVERGRAMVAGARFRQLDLMHPVRLEADQPPADFAICSEVLEHVADPVALMRHARALLAPGCRVVITVPGGPRSAFDRHIGHYQHFTAAKLRGVLEQAGYSVQRVLRAGFPFFNVYKLAVVARGRRLITDIEAGQQVAGGGLARRVLGFGFRHSLDNSPFGWQMAAVATPGAWEDTE